MFKIDQFSAAGEAAINQFSYFAQPLANVERFAELSSVPPDQWDRRPRAEPAGAKDVRESSPNSRPQPVMKRASRAPPATPPPRPTPEVKRVFEKQAAGTTKPPSPPRRVVQVRAGRFGVMVGSVKTDRRRAERLRHLAAINKRVYDTVEGGRAEPHDREVRDQRRRQEA